jgi:ArsR family transcriptional regulator
MTPTTAKTMPPVNDYHKYAAILKTLSDANRLRIVGMLSDGELCACKILEELAITQPTLSHHMKALCDSGLVRSRKSGKWTYYSLCCKAAEEFLASTKEILSKSENCICFDQLTREEDCCQ